MKKKSFSAGLGYKEKADVRREIAIRYLKGDDSKYWEERDLIELIENASEEGLDRILAQM